jgi:uncharacterized protein (DUF58 family)
MLSADDVRQLDALTFSAAGAAFSSNAGGARVARVQGFSTEFHDFRPYQPGDDPRAIEWTIYGRLGELVTRTSRTTAHLHVHLLVDASASMSLGAPAKMSCAAKMAALLSYVALRGRDAVGLAMFRDSIDERLAPAATRTQLFRIFAALERATPSGPSAIAAALMNYGVVESGPGLAVVISDFFDAAGVVDGLRYLQYRGLTPVVVEVLADEEIEPAIAGDVELDDVEASSAPPVVASAAAVTAYRAALAHDRAALRAHCKQHGFASLELRSSASFPELLEACSRAGLLLARR